MHSRALCWFLLLSPLIAGVLAHELEARAGGGGGYSGGSGGGGGSSGGGGDGAGIIIYLVIRLLVLLWTEGGPVGKVLCVVIVAGIAVFAYKTAVKRRQQQEELNRQGRLIQSRTQQRQQTQGVALIRRHDPNFSRVLFLDFAHLLYVKFHESRGGMGLRGDNAAIAPYLSPEIRRLHLNMATRVHEVVVGSLHLGEVWQTPTHLRVAVNYKANVVEEEAGRKTRWLYRHRLVLARPLHLLTQDPDKVMKLGCPACGSATELRLDGTCPSCGTPVGGGELDWQIVRVEINGRESVPEAVVRGGVEAGTDLPTVFAPDLGAQRRALQARDPEFSWPGFSARLRHMFMEIQHGWTTLDESRLRPWESDSIFDAHRYWLARYREEGTRNVLEQITIEKIDVARIEHDAWFDAITVRVFASMVDYHLLRDGSVAGNRHKPRRFSEYWTLVRRADRPRSRTPARRRARRARKTCFRAPWAASWCASRPIPT